MGTPSSSTGASPLALFFSNATPTTEIYTLSLHDALPIYCSRCVYYGKHQSFQATAGFRDYRSEERFSRNAETDLVCRLLLEKKNELNYETRTTYMITEFKFILIPALCRGMLMVLYFC